MFTYCFNNEFISIFFISLLCILYFYDDERCKMNFPVRDNKVLLYCILYCKEIPTQDSVTSYATYGPKIIDANNVLGRIIRLAVTNTAISYEAQCYPDGFVHAPVWLGCSFVVDGGSHFSVGPYYRSPFDNVNP